MIGTGERFEKKVFLAFLLSAILPYSALSEEVNCALTLRTKLPAEAASLQPPLGEVTAEVLLRATTTTAAYSSLRSQMAVPGQRIMTVPCGHWFVSLAAEGYWAQERAVHAEPAGQEVEFDLFPAGKVTATLAPPAGELLPKEIHARFISSPGAKAPGSIAPPEGRTSCPMSDSQFLCALPAGRSDVRLDTSPYAPLYLWSFTLGIGEQKDLGRLRLVPGASVVGWIRNRAGEPEAEVSVDLRPAAALHPTTVTAAALARVQAKSYQATTNERGFFQFSGVEEGGYELVARKRGFAPSTYPEAILVLDTVEIELADPLTLEDPAILELFVSPSTDPWGEDWEIDFGPEAAADSIAMPRIEAGVYRQSGLAAGRYTFSIRDSRGRIWLSQTDEAFAGETTPSQVFVPIVEVEGDVAFSDELTADVAIFTRPGSSTRFELFIDDNGGFGGFLPGEGSYGVIVGTGEAPRLAVELGPVEVTAGPSGVARLDLEIPDTTLAGEVLFPDGTPAADVEVVARRTATVSDFVAAESRLALVSSLTNNAKTDDSGGFLFRGLKEGEFSIFARTENREMTSSPETVRLLEDQTAPHLRLVLREHIQVGGVVWSDRGAVAGAQVVVWPDTVRHSDTAGIHGALSDVDGSFSFEVPSTTDSVYLLAVAPGFGIVLEQQVLKPKEIVLVNLERASGRLILEYPIATKEGELPIEYALFHAGGLFSVHLLSAATMPLVVEGALVFESFKPGLYSLCGLNSAREILVQGGDPTPGCSTGVLAPHSELLLSLKSPTSTAKSDNAKNED